MSDFDKVETVVEEEVEELADLEELVGEEEEFDPIGGVKKRNRLTVAIRFHDGSVLEGEMNMAGSNRLSDFLNDSKDFLVVLDRSRKAHIVNKHYILKVVELEPW